MGFLEPLAFAFCSLYAVLVLFYLRERWQRREMVPSLLLWRLVRQDAVRGRRFVPDLLFFLRLLLLTALIAALARPYLADEHATAPGARRVIVLDTSASMQAEEPLGTRFEQARERAREIVAEAAPGTEILLVYGGRTPTVAVDFTRDRAHVLRALRQAVPTDTGADITLAIHLAENARAHSDQPTEIDVLTDIPHADLPAEIRDRVNVVSFGESDDNIAIEALQISQGRFQGPLAAHAQVILRNFAHREQHGVLTVLHEDVVLHRTGFTLAPRESQGFLFRDFERSGRVTARLDGRDALDADDFANGWVRPVHPAEVLLVSPPSPLVREIQDVAEASAALRVSVVSPEKFDAGDAARFDTVIYHAFVPPEWDGSNALFVHPPPGNHLLPVAGEAEGVEVLDWNERHPAVSSLRPLVALPLHSARIVNAPDWAEPLLTSRTAAREFPLAFAGERSGRRFAGLTFDLAAERLLAPDSSDILLLFMSLLSWLAPHGDEVLVVRTGEVTRLDGMPDGVPIQVHGPHGDRTAVPPEAPLFEPLFAGAYRIGANGSSKTLVANFFDPVESDIGRATSGSVAATATEAGDATTRGVPVGAEYATWLYALGALLLLIEWGVSER